MDNTLMRKCGAELLGTFTLTLFGCGTAAIAGQAVGTVGIALAFGLSIVCMAFAIGHISGCHINPAVSLGVFLAKRMTAKEMVAYWVAQFIGGILAAAVLVFIMQSSGLDIATAGLGCNGFGDASSVGISLGGAFVVEVILTCVFVMTILGVTGHENTSAYAGLIIGLTLVFVHLFGIALTGTSVNPARSFGPALFMTFFGNGTPLAQVWVFIVAPLVGAAFAAGLYQFLTGKEEA
ncbi:MAG: aquaporin [Phoenicibacter congonensis]|uniref:Aquaporin n=1 Tax=Phoenicibacter congonensis TaxID=1944646 RepID=A0AA43RIN8_9ACTN|nr:aquaporin [Phoenicibacter congonensis]